MEIVKWEKARFERNSLVISDNVTKDEWKELGKALKQVEGCVQFWIGDWARFGEKKGYTGKYTDSKVYDELEEITGLDHGTLKNYKSVADNVQSSLRHDDLSFNHHVEVAKLDPEKQAEYLQKASDEKLSVRDLREKIRSTELEKETRKRHIELEKNAIEYAKEHPEEVHIGEVKYYKIGGYKCKCLIEGQINGLPIIHNEIVDQRFLEADKNTQEKISHKLLHEFDFKHGWSSWGAEISL